MVAPLGACYAWMLDTSPSAVSVSYGPPLYTGPVSGLDQAGLQGGPVQLQVTGAGVTGASEGG